MSISHSFQDLFTIENKWILSGENRLNASSYSSDLIKAKNEIDKLNKKNISIKKIDDFSDDIFVGARSKRLFTNEKRGVPYLMPVDLFMFDLKPRKWVKKETKDLDNWWVEPNTILITQSGTPGRVILSNELFNEKVVSPNVIRFVPNKEGKELLGYIYAYLSSWIGQAYLTKEKYGATVKHIEPYHVGEIPIPIIPEIKKEINKKILKSHKLLEMSQKLLKNANRKVYKDIGLPKININNVNFLGNNSEKNIKAFEVKFNDLDLRLDGSYHTPLAHFGLSEMKKAEGVIDRLENLADLFVPPRFKRAYVKKPTNKDVPLLQGSHITQIKPLDIKYLWNKMSNLASYIVRKNWILATCSGTIGHLSLVGKQWDGWAATNHLLRIIPKEDKINSGYLYTFLKSKYGKIQFQRLTYGGVVDEIGEAGELFNDIKILQPKNKKLENEIGDIALDAYERRDQANILEESAIKKLENSLSID